MVPEIGVAEPETVNSASPDATCPQLFTVKLGIFRLDDVEQFPHLIASRLK
jgi:hypothetical protein